MTTPDHQKGNAGLSPEEFKNLTPEQAIEIVLERMADMFEALNAPFGEDLKVPSRPVRPDEPAHLTLVRWSPILSDYGVFARRANTASKAAEEAKRDRDHEVYEARRLQYAAESEGRTAVRTLRNAKKSLQEALTLLETGEPA